jgi:hypothetical protein
VAFSRTGGGGPPDSAVNGTPPSRQDPSPTFLDEGGKTTKCAFRFGRCPIVPAPVTVLVWKDLENGPARRPRQTRLFEPGLAPSSPLA